MAQIEILEEIKKLPTIERLTIIESALHLVYEDIQEVKHPIDRTSKKRQMATAAKVLLPDYASSGELTAFTSLDSERFYA